MSSLKDHRNRWITGVVGLTIVVTVVGCASKPIFFLFMLLILFFVLNEFYGLGSCSSNSKALGIALGLTLTGGFYFLDHLSLLALLTGMGVFLCIASVVAFEKRPSSEVDLERQLLGTFIITLLFSHLVWLRGLQEGKLWIFFLLSVVFAGDTFAFYGGTLLGRHKLSPKISPRKTVEGVIAGLVGSCLGAVVFSHIFFRGFSLSVMIPLSIMLGILSQFGDLWESMLKRSAKVKDSGKILPGHGGFFDRVDSILFPAPILYHFILLNQRWL
jgi:phosphatidate cytidylyltransferase